MRMQNFTIMGVKINNTQQDFREEHHYQLHKNSILNIISHHNDNTSNNIQISK